MAGESARESARRQREKGERLLRSAELWERGAHGEELTGQQLAKLDPALWTVFHDLRWPGRQWANIDHVVVGPPGVFVIDSKNWSGSVTVADSVLRQNGRSREKSVAGAVDAAIALAAELRSIDARRVYPVLCFVREEPIDGWAREVMCAPRPTSWRCSTRDLHRSSLRDRERLHARLKRSLRDSESTRKLARPLSGPLRLVRQARSELSIRNRHAAHRATCAERDLPVLTFCGSCC